MASFDPNAPAQAGSGIYGLPPDEDAAGVIVIPVPWEPTTSYRRGTVGGPAAVLAASRQVDLYDVETGKPYEAGIVMIEESADVRAWNEAASIASRPIIDAGGEIEGDRDLEQKLALVNELGGKLNDWLFEETARRLAAGKLVAVLGGDHACPYGAILATARKHPGMGVLHLDAHADLRDAYEGFTWSHASIMHNVATRIPEVARLVQVGIRDFGEAEAEMIRGSGGRIVAHFDAELAARRFAGESWSAQCARIIASLPHEVYLSFDVDGLDPTLCPSTGTPVPGGLSFAEVSFLMGELVRSGRVIVGLDLDEVAPGEDGDEWDANVGARLLYKMIGWALRSRASRA